jgi:MoaA/NifB/PqqE/SkfB family radical SAM enzyme
MIELPSFTDIDGRLAMLSPLSSPKLQRLVIETTRRCNLRCIHCAVSEENNLGGYDAQDLPIDLFRKLLPILRKFRPAVQLSGHGETFLHPNFMEMLEEVARAGCGVEFQTNGTILTARNIDQIVRAGVERIAISIDAASPELFEKIRRRAKLEKIVENIRVLNETKKRLNKDRPLLSFEFVAMRQNIHELPAVIRMAGELGVPNLQVAELKEYNLTRDQSLANEPLMAEWASRAELEARRLGINLILPPNIPGRQVAGPVSPGRGVDPADPTTYRGLRKTCKEPWESMFVQFNGEVRPCCVISESYGDLPAHSFEEVWKGTKYQALRASLLTDKPFLECVQCPFYGWEPIDVPKQARQDSAPKGFQGAWRSFVRKVVGSPECTVQLSDQQILWLLNQLGSTDPQQQLGQIRQRIKSLPEACLDLLENGQPASPSAFVERCYQELLGREPDADGLRGYVEAIELRNVTRLQTVAQFLSSSEFERLLLRKPNLFTPDAPG